MKPMPASSTHRATPSGVCSSLTPQASSTSAAPAELDAARLPCLATFTPEAASVRAAAVEMLKVLRPSPPVPTTSTTGPGTSTRSTLARMTRAMPAISSEVSPFSRSAVTNAPICAGVAVPDMISSMQAEASSVVSDLPSINAPMDSRIMAYSNGDSGVAYLTCFQLPLHPVHELRNVRQVVGDLPRRQLALVEVGVQKVRLGEQHR